MDREEHAAAHDMPVAPRAHPFPGVYVGGAVGGTVGDGAEYVQMPGVKVRSHTDASVGPHSSLVVHVNAQCVPVPTGS